VTAASLGIAALLDGPEQPLRLLSDGPHAQAWVAESGAVLVLESEQGAHLPNAVHGADVTRLRRLGVSTSSVGGGRWTADGTEVRVRRWWDPVPRRVTVRADAVAALATSLPPPPPDPARAAIEDAARARRPDRLVGLGTGSTPGGDDWLAARLVTLWAVGRNDDAAVLWADVEPRLEATTPLSADLLRHAARGAAALAVHGLLDAVSGRTPPGLALHDVLALGHTSGWWLARGVIDTAAEHQPLTRLPSRNWEHGSAVSRWPLTISGGRRRP
jgi:hypothetical protein